MTRSQKQPQHALRTRSGRVLGRGAVLLAVGVAVLGVAGTAEAYWQSAAGGSGSAGAGSVSALTNVTATASGSKLYPGGSGDVTLTVHNPNSHSVVITGATVGTITGCTTPAVTVTPGTLPTIAANSDQSVTWTGAAAMALTASNDCQGVTLTVPLTLTGKLS